MSFKTTLCIALDRRKIIGMTAPMSLTSILIIAARAAMATEELSPPFNVSITTDCRSSRWKGKLDIHSGNYPHVMVT